MLLTSGLLFIAMRDIWGWRLLKSGVIAGAFICIDSAFFLASMFGLMERKSMHVSDFFLLPKDRVILIGRQAAI